MTAGDGPVTTAPLRLAASAAALADDFARVRADLDVPAGFPPDVDAEAAAVAARGPGSSPPGVPDARRLDARDLELVTIDPAGSRDLDQAFHAERQGTGFRVHYAIADVAAFVAPGGALDREAFARGETLYLPDGRAPLYPDVLGEGAASLLPDVDRPALLWTFELDEDARPIATRCERATVRSRAAQSYVEVQAALDHGDASPSVALLRELGERLLERERERGGVSIAAPGQEVVRDADGSYSLELEAPLPGRDVERADLAAHRSRSGASDGRGRRGTGAHPAAPRRRNRRSPPSHGARARRRVALGRGVRRRRARAPARHPGARHLPAPGAPRAARRGVRSGHARRRPRRSTPRWARRTRTSPRRCDASPTASPTRWCSPWPAGTHRRRGRSTRCPVSSR